MDERIKYIRKLAEKGNVSALRELRDTDCFPIINRGELWYATLSTEEKLELEQWYSDWLNVTNSLEIPIKPSWLE